MIFAGREGAMRIVIGVAMLGIALTGCAGRKPVQLNAARRTAIRECSIKAAKFPTRNRLTIQFAAYGGCMVAAGQPWP